MGYTDGSRIDNVSSAASVEGGIYLGEWSTVMDVEMVGIAMAFQEGYTTVASDSQAAIRHCRNLTSAAQEVRSWIDEWVVGAAKRERALMWV